MTEAQARATLGEIFSGAWDQARIQTLLAELSARGETVDEIVGFAQAMRAAVADIGLGPEPPASVDNCGTGGGGRRTFNISTAAALVAAGAGAQVAKHGNRSTTSVCGSADVLEAAGVDLACPPERLGRCLREVGMAFLFAPLLHPAMRHVMPARRALGTRTVFNLLGPLTNPAGAQAQVIGVAAEGQLRLLAAALAGLGTRHSLVVYSEDGLGEFSTAAVNRVIEIKAGVSTGYNFDARDLRLPPPAPGALDCGTKADAVAALDRLLAGETGAYRDIVLLNAAAALLVGGLARNWHEGLEMSAASLASGAARAKLNALVAFTGSRGEHA
ncbi:MAG TPA: anthranilate phosphoribosyltransferase [Terriglobales bacterium]|nr:anthranilate phosphoribosyltransferase [Terriglobales bacterium]